MELPDSAIAYLETVRKEAESRIEEKLSLSKRTAGKAVKQLRGFFKNWKIRSKACVDSPAWAIVKEADEWKPDLIVVGSHGASALTRFFLGSVSRSVLIHSKKSVRIVRYQSRKEKRPLRIILGVDGSEDARKALHTIAERKWPKKTQVRLVTAFDEKMSSAIASHYLVLHAKKGGVSFPSSEKAWMRRVMKPFADRLRNEGLEVSDAIKAGKPWKIIVNEAENWKADCIFVGARGLGAWKRFLLGSVSDSVASGAHCSVEVVR